MKYWGMAEESVKRCQEAMEDQKIRVDPGNMPRDQFLEIEIKNSRGALIEIEKGLKENSPLLHQAAQEFLE